MSNIQQAREILGELAGAVSLCWEPRPTGVFDATTAKKWTDEALEKLVKAGLVKDIPVDTALDS